MRTESFIGILFQVYSEVEKFSWLGKSIGEIHFFLWKRKLKFVSREKKKKNNKYLKVHVKFLTKNYRGEMNFVVLLKCISYT